MTVRSLLKQLPQIDDDVILFFERHLATDTPVVMTDVRIHRRARCHYLWLPEITGPRLHQSFFELLQDLHSRGHEHYVIIRSLERLDAWTVQFQPLTQLPEADNG